MAGGVEQAIVELVLQGTGEFNAATGKVQADLGSVERAGKQAESASAKAAQAAASAERSVQELQAGIGRAISRANQAVHLLSNLGKAVGVIQEGSTADTVLDVFGQALGGAASGAALGSVAGAPGVVVGSVVGGVSSAFVALDRKEEEIRRHNAAVDRRTTAAHEDAVVDSILREVGLAKLGRSLAGPRDVR